MKTQSITGSTGASTSKAESVSSPAATGGAGTFFEQHVDAFWLAQLLVRAIPPILFDCSVAEVHLQTEHLGWHTDDFLIVGQNGTGNQRHLAGQVKRSFTVSATDDECNKAIKDFWMDFKNPQRFSPTTDRFSLVVLRGTNTLLEHFSGLLDCARSASDATEFGRRLATPGFISAKAISYHNEIQTIIEETEEKQVSAVDVWSFLRVLHVLSLDFNSATRQTEAMIKSLLAYTASGPDALGVAETSWNALLREVGDGMPAARSYRHTDLPEALRQRHSVIGGTEQQALRALKEHSALILNGIRSTIGNDLQLSRYRLVQQIIEQIGLNQVVLVVGPAGSGKSGVAKDAIGTLTKDHFAFSFRAEEFAHSHFDGTLQNAQIPINAATLGTVMAAQDRKVLLVESVERLLEKSTRDAFTDLLTLLAKDNSWRLVLTCRDYSADLVRSCFLSSAGFGYSVVVVPPLDDEELGEVEAAYPMAARPLANTTLRLILRNPYILDKALGIRWSEEIPLPQSEREFRDLCWREIVRVDHQPAEGMPRRREETFVQIALRRARALDLYASCGDLDPQVVEKLQRDSLIVASQQSHVLVAPAHDVLEDWAILQWIEEQYATANGSIQALAAAVGTHPAVRRTFRKWVDELVERNPKIADGLFRSVVHHEGELSAHFCDDTLISLLRSSESASFLERHRTDLFASDKKLLKRVIHLLRVACVTAPDWLTKVVSLISSLNIPDGPAWACVLRLTHTHLQSFTENDQALLMGFIEDWARGISWQNPYPSGAESAAAIAYWLLSGNDDYRSESQRKRILQVIAKIPKADLQRFALLLQGTCESENRDRTVRDFQDLIFDSLEGMPAARDLPDVFVSAAKDWLLSTEEDLKREWYYAGPVEMEALFGIKDRRSFSSFPASAYHGPFLPFLRYHPAKGLLFIIEIFNHSADWYAHPRVRFDYVEPPFEITLTFSDGYSRKQWCNARLWNLYRGTSVGPYVLQSLLMALECWLLEYAEAFPDKIGDVLLSILRRSDSAALSAVVASVATAFPHASGEVLLVLLRSPECIRLDRTRMVHESQALSHLAGFMPQLNARNETYETERKEADARSHRRIDLETAILNLQIGPLAHRVHEILDRHRAVMPPLDEQNEEDRLWRLALHRMDFRQYRIDMEADEAPAGSIDNNETKNSRQLIRLTPIEPDADVQEMVVQAADNHQAMNAKLGLEMWGQNVFTHEINATYDPAQWRNRLQEARTTATGDMSSEEGFELGRSGPGIVAAVCVRDHWEEMSEEERDWCVNSVCFETEQNGDHWNQHARIQRYSMSADRSCALVLPLLLGKTTSEAQGSRINQAFVIALTHAIDEVRWYAVSGIGSYVWTFDRELALRCVNAIAMEAKFVQETFDADRHRRSPKRREIDDIEAEAAAMIRRLFFTPNGIPADAYQSLNLTRWFGAEANARILSILSQAPTETVSVAAFERLAHILVDWWAEDDQRRADRDHEHRERNHQTESTLTSLLESFLLRTATVDAIRIIEPLVAAINRHPDQVHWLVRGLICIEDQYPNTPQFWTLWEQLAEGVRRAKWLARIEAEHAFGNVMIIAIFLNISWKNNVRHWRSLDGHADHVHALFEDLPATSSVLEAYLRFLYHIGEQSLPEAFILIAKRFQQGNPRQMLRDGNNVFMLEDLLQRYVYGKPLELKRRKDLRESVLLLLDLLVENGSSSAFRMRDDFVTPVSNTAYVYLVVTRHG